MTPKMSSRQALDHRKEGMVDHPQVSMVLPKDNTASSKEAMVSNREGMALLHRNSTANNKEAMASNKVGTVSSKADMVVANLNNSSSTVSDLLSRVSRVSRAVMVSSKVDILLKVVKVVMVLLLPHATSLKQLTRDLEGVNCAQTWRCLVSFKASEILSVGLVKGLSGMAKLRYIEDCLRWSAMRSSSLPDLYH